MDSSSRELGDRPRSPKKMKTLSLKELAALTMDPAAIRMIPESVARDSIVLPSHWSGASLHVVVPSDAGLADDPTFFRLGKILNCDYTFDYALRDDLKPFVDLFYTAIYAEIENCDQFRFRCPKQFAQLASTTNPLVRHCSTCKQDVHYCRTEEELSKLANEGKCVAFFLAEHPQDFVGLPM